MISLAQEFNELRNKYISELLLSLEMGDAEVNIIGDGFEDVISFNDDIFLNFETIRYVVDNGITAFTFHEWWKYSIRLGTLGIEPPSFKDFWKNYPLRSEEELVEMEKMQKKIEELKKDLEKLINNASY